MLASMSPDGLSLYHTRMSAPKLAWAAAIISGHMAGVEEVFPAKKVGTAHRIGLFLLTTATCRRIYWMAAMCLALHRAGYRSLGMFPRPVLNYIREQGAQEYHAVQLKVSPRDRTVQPEAVAPATSEQRDMLDGVHYLLKEKSPPTTSHYMFSLPAWSSGLQGLYIWVLTLQTQANDSDIFIFGYCFTSMARLAVSRLVILSTERWLADVEAAKDASPSGVMDHATKERVMHLTTLYTILCGVFHAFLTGGLTVSLWWMSSFHRAEPVLYAVSVCTVVAYCLCTPTEFAAALLERKHGVNYVSTSLRILVGGASLIGCLLTNAM